MTLACKPEALNMSEKSHEVLSFEFSKVISKQMSSFTYSTKINKIPKVFLSNSAILIKIIPGKNS